MPEGSRRQFLGAAAAVATLSWPSDPQGSTGEDAVAPEQAGGTADSGTDTGGYGARTAARTVGDLLLFEPGDRNRTTEVEVTSYAEGVGLSLGHDAARMNAMLLPEDVDRVIDELAAAKDRLVDREVEEAREWIDEDYRE